MGLSNKIPRQEISFTATAVDGNKLRIRMLDRINIDDIVLHNINRRLHELVTGSEQSVDIPRAVKDFLVKERTTVR